jgi:hypothetical protein
MKPCPCGCSRQLGWSDARIANSAGLVVSLLPIVERTAAVMTVSGSPEAVTAQGFAAEGLLYAQRVLRVAHGDHSPQAKRTMPSLSEGMAWIRRANQLPSALGKMDPEWMIWYKKSGAPPANLDGLREGDIRGAKLRGRQASPPPPIPEPTRRSESAKAVRQALPSERVGPQGATTQSIGRYLPDTTVEYATDAFSEGVQKLFREEHTPMPQPMRIIEHHAADIFSAYLVQREQWAPLEALCLSFAAALSSNACGEVMAFVQGKSRERYSLASSYQTMDQVMILAEFWSGRVSPIEVKNTRFETVSVIDLCHEMAADELSISRFCVAFDQNPDAAAEIAGGAAALIVGKCRQEDSPNESLEHAIGIFQRHVSTSEASGPNGVNQLLWCRTVGASISSQLET